MSSASLGQRKVAIPRLQRVGGSHSTMKDRRRVPRACTACRSHKIKCTGERPRCKHCANSGRECVYIMPRKDRLKIMTERCHQMAELLQTLKKSANPRDSVAIAEALEAIEEETTDFRITATASNPDTEFQDPMDGAEQIAIDHQSAADHQVAVNHRAEIDTESLDLLDEDLHHERARPTGFIGKNSEIQWLRAVAAAQTDRIDEMNDPLGRRGSYVPTGGDQTNTFSYWADSEHVDLDFFVDAYELPQAETAERLLQCYMTKVHDSFPILPRKTFEDQFRMYFSALLNGKAPRLSPKWQSILNLIFAIAARHSHLVKAPWRADERDHLLYQARARTLGLNDTTVTSHSDVSHIQSLGLLAFYWLSTGQVSRSWTIVGIALRAAYSLGLHVRNEDPSATAAKKETLVRTWWSLYSLERSLSIITGRPSIIVDSCCSVPLPIPIAEDRVSDDLELAYADRRRNTTHLPLNVPSGATSDVPPTPVGFSNAEANSGSYFNAVTQLSIITQNILVSLYSAGTMIRSPYENQQHVSQLNQRLEQWYNSLPPEFYFQHRQHVPGVDSPFTRERTLLAFQFCSARMLLGRPYLSARSQMSPESNEETFAKRMANACIEAAKTIIHHLPDDVRSEIVYDQGPWWCIVHHLMQAISVLLLGLSFPAATSRIGVMLATYVKKAIKWLQVQDPLAERAAKVALTSFAHVARRHNIDMSDLWPRNTPNRLQMQDQMHMNVPGISMPRFQNIQQHDFGEQSSNPLGMVQTEFATYDMATASTAFSGNLQDHDERSQGLGNEPYFLVR